MATKHKQRAKHGSAGLLQQGQRSLEKGNFKQALKDAKVCYRQQPSPEARLLLERAYLARGRQLYRAGLGAESQAAIETLLQLGVTDASVRQELPELLIALGLFDRVAGVGGEGKSLESDSLLHASAADHAVLRPSGAPASLPGIRQGAETIRRALAALEAGNEAQAMAVLKDIPRASPSADWKYFVRGLAAYYRQDAAEMQANWQRLDAGRFAARIAAPLKALADPDAVSADDSRMADTLARLGSEALGGRILARLQKLQDHVIAGRWREAVRLLRTAGPLFRQVESTLPQRIAMVLCGTLARKGAPATLRELAKVAEPPPIDPHWNRVLAMASEQSEDEDLIAIERHWRAYLDDLAHVECLLPAERTLAQALVWLRLGRLLVDESSPMCPTCGVRHHSDEEAQAEAVECFENSLKLAPELLTAYQGLAEAFEEWGEPEQAAATHRRLVERFPENIESLLLLAAHYVKCDQPLTARDYILRAQRLKPLDAGIKSLVWAVHLGSARHHALAGRWDEGRAEFAAAEKVGGQQAEAHHLLVRRAALEFKAGDFGLAHRLLDRAWNELGESAPVWLLMTIESIRYALPKAMADEFEYRWLAAIKKSRPSPAVGEMCRIMLAHLTIDVNYAGWEYHVGHLLDCLRRCSRTRWQARDLRNVLEFLLYWEHREKKREEGPRRRSAPSDIAELLEDFADKARTKFPENAFFQFVAGEMEMREGPRECDREFVRDSFQRVVDLTEGAKDPDSEQLAKRARENLHLLDEFKERPFDGIPPFPAAVCSGGR